MPGAAEAPSVKPHLPSFTLGLVGGLALLAVLGTGCGTTSLYPSNGESLGLQSPYRTLVLYEVGAAAALDSSVSRLESQGVLERPDADSPTALGWKSEYVTVPDSLSAGGEPIEVRFVLSVRSVTEGEAASGYRSGVEYVGFYRLGSGPERPVRNFADSDEPAPEGVLIAYEFFESVIYASLRGAA